MTLVEFVSFFFLLLQFSGGVGLDLGFYCVIAKERRPSEATGAAMQ